MTTGRARYEIGPAFQLGDGRVAQLELHLGHVHILFGDEARIGLEWLREERARKLRDGLGPPSASVEADGCRRLCLQVFGAVFDEPIVISYLCVQVIRQVRGSSTLRRLSWYRAPGRPANPCNLRRRRVGVEGLGRLPLLLTELRRPFWPVPARKYVAPSTKRLAAAAVSSGPVPCRLLLSPGEPVSLRRPASSVGPKAAKVTAGRAKGDSARREESMTMSLRTAKSRKGSEEERGGRIDRRAGRSQRRRAPGSTDAATTGGRGLRRRRRARRMQHQSTAKSRVRSLTHLQQPSHPGGASSRLPAPSRSLPSPP